jgi:hypothetical protein
VIWRDGEMERWRDGEMERWIGGSVADNDNLERSPPHRKVLVSSRDLQLMHKGHSSPVGTVSAI